MARWSTTRNVTATRALLFFGLACASQETSCPVEPLPPGYCAGFAFEGSHPCVSLSIYPATGDMRTRILIRDTLQFNTISDSGFASPVTWSVAGSAGTIVPGSTQSDGLGQSSVLVAGVQAGSATVTATHATNRAATSTVSVSDSSVITSITLNVSMTTLKVGAVASLIVILKDAAGLQYNAEPDRLTSSDSTIGEIEIYASGITSVRVKKVGTVTIRAHFQSLQSSAVLTVVP